MEWGAMNEIPVCEQEVVDTSNEWNSGHMVVDTRDTSNDLVINRQDCKTFSELISFIGVWGVGKAIKHIYYTTQKQIWCSWQYHISSVKLSYIIFDLGQNKLKVLIFKDLHKVTVHRLNKYSSGWGLIFQLLYQTTGNNSV